MLRMDIDVVINFIFIGVLGLGIIFVLLLFLDLKYQIDKNFEACQNIGMEKKTINNFQTCVDSQGNANIVDFECKGFLWDKQCSVQIIKLQTFGVDING